jgi:2'-5' RNA ligase
MQTLQFYRYFLGLRPNPQMYPLFQRICEALGLPSRLDLLHLTLCVIAETEERDHFVARRVRRALCDAKLHSFAVNLSRVRAGPHGAIAHTFGRQDEIQDFYSALARLLRACGIQPLHRKSGLHPHVTLGHRACEAELLRIAIRWFPSELMLIESEVGRTKHNVLERWSLLPPRQSLLPFDDGIAPRRDERAAVAAG